LFLYRCVTLFRSFCFLLFKGYVYFLISISKSILSLCQSRLYPPVRDLAFENVVPLTEAQPIYKLPSPKLINCKFFALLSMSWFFSKRRTRSKVPACLWGERIWPGYQHLIAETSSSAKYINISMSTVQYCLCTVLCRLPASIIEDSFNTFAYNHSWASSFSEIAIHCHPDTGRKNNDKEGFILLPD
jgi:hypothetical protein